MKKDYGVIIYSEEFVSDVVDLRGEGLKYRDIASSLEVSLSTVNHAVVAHNRGFPTVAKFHDGFAISRGFSSFSAYDGACREIREVVSSEGSLLQEELISPLQLESLVLGNVLAGGEYVHQLTPALESRYLDVLSLLEEFPEREQQIVKDHFFERRSYVEIGRKHGLARERISQIISEMLPEIKAMYEGVSVPKPKNGIKLSEGELLLIRSISYIPDARGDLNYWVDLVNQLFHDGFRVRTRGSILTHMQKKSSKSVEEQS